MGIKTSTTVLAYDATLKVNGVSTVDQQRLNLTSYRSGNENPQWKRTISEGGNATTNLTAYTESASTSAGFWSGTEYGTKLYSSSRQGVYLNANPKAVPSGTVSRANAEATAKAYKKLNSLVSDFQGQVFAGELKETKDLLINPFKQSVELMRALIRARDIGKEAAQSWLEFQFGILPLLSDVDAIITLVNGKVKKEKRLSFRTYAKAEDNSSSMTVTPLDIYGFNQSVETRESLRAECIKHFAISQKFLDSANERKADWSSSFTDLSSVPATIWELVPWSFLVDYVVNVSDIIQAASTSLTGVTFFSNSTIRTYEKTVVGSTTSVLAPRFVITSNIPRVFSYKRRDVSRDGTPLGIPSVTFSLPGSNIRYLNIAALIVSLKK